MGRLLAISILSWALLSASAQLPSAVDINLVASSTPGKYDVRLRPNGASFNGSLDALVFSIRWAAGTSGISVPEPACAEGIPLNASNEIQVGGVKYVKYTSAGTQPLSVAGCPLPADTWTTVASLWLVVDMGCKTFNIVNDATTASMNGDFQVVVGGVSKTGAIVGTGVAICAPTSIDINLVPSNLPGRLEVRLRANGAPYHGLMSQLMFTIRWPAASSASLGTRTLSCPDAMPASPQPQQTNGGYKYRTYLGLSFALLGPSGCSWPADTWVTVCTIPVVSTGCTSFSIVNDAWTTANNRDYFVSLGGTDANLGIVPNSVTICGIDCQGMTNGPAQPGTPCNDGIPCTVNDLWSPACVCAGILSDFDNDEVCDDVDNCPTVPGQVGSACDDGNASTLNDVLRADCTCSGTGCLLQAKVFLEGPYNPAGSTMEDHLRDAGLLPALEPYSAMGYTFFGGGGETANISVLAVDNSASAKVDWVIVELRSAANPSLIVTSRAALLCRSGTITSEEGALPLVLQAPAASYYVAIRHRNHLGVMTAVPYIFNQGLPLSLDFTLTATAMYGTNARKNVSGAETLWAGDVTFNGELKYTGASNDRDPILTTVGSTTPNNSVNLYSTRDVNMDGTVKYTGSGNDRDPILVNVGSTTPNNVRTRQLP